MDEAIATHPEAVWFGHDRARSFGMLHRSARPSGKAVVICNTLGFDGLLAHRPFRHLAEALTGLGFTVLRLDYVGTGDASGDSGEPAHLSGLLQNLHDAVELMRGREHCSTISLIGIRFGATLACRYALDHPVDNLVLWAPCERGAAYVRELNVLNRLSSGSRPPQAVAEPGTRRPGLLEVVGFEFTPELLDEVASIDLLTEVDRPLARRILVLDRDETPPSIALVDALRATGAVTDHEKAAGWAQFMVPDETESEIPVEALDAIAGWMGAAQDGPRIEAVPDFRRRNGHGQTALLVDSVFEDAVTERPVWIGRLFALVSEPPADVPSRHSVVVMANTGSVNRSGPGRLYVQLARRWAGLGFTVIRVDLGGTGDSPAPAGSAENVPYSPERTDELLATVDWARKNTDADDISLFGICSGAFHAFKAAVLQASVNRLILVNPAIFYLAADDTVRNSTGKAVTAAHNLHRFGFLRSQLPTALRSPRSLIGFLRRAARGFIYLWAARGRRVLGGIGITVREPEDLARDLNGLAGEGITTLAVFAAGEPGARYMRAFGGSTLTRLIARGDVTVVDIDGGDHVFSPPEARKTMADAVTGHLESVRPVLSLVGAARKEA